MINNLDDCSDEHRWHFAQYVLNTVAEFICDKCGATKLVKAKVAPDANE